jgi:hypothetical protein
MSFERSVAFSIRRIITDPAGEIHKWFDVSGVEFSAAASDRTAYWLAKFLAYLSSIPGPFQSTPPIRPPDSWSAVIRPYGPFTAAQASDAYFFLVKLVKFTLEFGRSKVDRHRVTVDNVSEAVRNPLNEVVSPILLELQIARPKRLKRKSSRKNSRKSSRKSS